MTSSAKVFIGGLFFGVVGGTIISLTIYSSFLLSAITK